MRLRTRSKGLTTDKPVLLTTTTIRKYPYSYQEIVARPVFNGYDGYYTEECIDEVHPKRFGKYIQGGPLDLRRHEVKPQATSVSVKMEDASKIVTCYGTTYPIFYGAPAAGLAQTALPASGLSAAQGAGATAWNKFKPGKPKTSMSVFIAELRDLPSMLKAKSYAHRNLGKHYLAYQFGWLPFLSDLRKMYQTQQRMEQILENIHHLNGKWIRRHGTVEDTTSGAVGWNLTGSSLPVFDPMIPYEVARSFRSSGYSSTHVKVWFAGAFRYYVRDVERKLMVNPMSRNLRRKIMGLTMTPADVWEAIPWSWLIDYFSNVGDILSNMDSGFVDELVAKYAYVMRSQVTMAHQVSLATCLNGTTIQGTIERTIETKARAVADPFGFDVGGNLTSHQLGILAALGISRI